MQNIRQQFEHFQTTTPATKLNPFDFKLLEYVTDAIGFLGAGYYAFGRQKKAEYYTKSREKIGALLALYYFHQNSPPLNFTLDTDQIENNLLPAYAALIRKLEGKNERT